MCVGGYSLLLYAEDSLDSHVPVHSEVSYSEKEESTSIMHAGYGKPDLAYAHLSTYLSSRHQAI